MLSPTELATQAGVPLRVLDAIKGIESAGNPRAVRFETRLFARDDGRTVNGHDRAAFNAAFRLNPRVAVTSTSWGLWQVLGSTLLRIYPDPAQAVNAFDADPVGVSQQLIVKYFQSRPALRDAIARQDWHALAMGYNGSETWYTRFLAAMGGAAAGGALLLVGAAGLAVWWYWRRA